MKDRKLKNVPAPDQNLRPIGVLNAGSCPKPFSKRESMSPELCG
jgi:hypothetical protein